MIVDASRRDLDAILAAQDPGGAIVAARSYPPYRHAWLRDGSFAAHACSVAGEAGAATRFHDWVGRVVVREQPRIERAMAAARSGAAPGPDDHLACRYEPDGTTVPGEWGSFQLDGPALWLWALEDHVRRTATTVASRTLGCAVPGTSTEPAALAPGADVARAAGLVARYLAVLWTLPCHDAWEEYPERVHASTLGAILAGLRAADRLGVFDPVVRAAIPRVEACLRANGRVPGHLSKWYGNPAADGSLLWIGPVLGVLEPADPLWTRTLATIERDLRASHGGVYRYLEDSFYGGGEWPVLTASLGLAYLQRARVGDRDRAAGCLEWIDAQAGPSGDLPEQVTCHALHPDRVETWHRRWGPVACPLTWSHAMALLLRRAMDAP